MRTRIAVMTKANARKKIGYRTPCGTAAPSKLMAGKCQHDQTTPIYRLALREDFRDESCCDANPVHPTSSISPAGIPKNTPIAKKFGLKTCETSRFNANSTAKTRQGGMRRTSQQRPGSLAWTETRSQGTQTSLPLEGVREDSSDT